MWFLCKYLWTCNLLQCPYEAYLDNSDKTWHIFTHFIRKTEEQLRQYVQNYILQRPDWFTKVSSTYLKHLGNSVPEYVDQISTPGNALDLLGMFVLSRVYEFHFGVLFVDDTHWCTAEDNDLDKCLMKLGFRGFNKFSETCNIGQTADYLDILIRNTEQGFMPSHNMDSKVFDEPTCDQGPDSDIEFVGYEVASYIPRVELKGEVKPESSETVDMKNIRS